LLISEETDKTSDDASCGGDAAVITSVLLENGLNSAFCSLEGWMIKTNSAMGRDKGELDMTRYQK
jgi:hypothetical protein